MGFLFDVRVGDWQGLQFLFYGVHGSMNMLEYNPFPFNTLTLFRIW